MARVPAVMTGTDRGQQGGPGVALVRGKAASRGGLPGASNGGIWMRKSYLIALRSIKLSSASIAAQEFVFSEMKSYPQSYPQFVLQPYGIPGF